MHVYTLFLELPVCPQLLCEALDPCVSGAGVLPITALWQGAHPSESRAWARAFLFPPSLSP